MVTRRNMAVLVTIVLAVGSAGVLKGAFFARDFVCKQLAEQKISFSSYEKDKETYDSMPSLKKYAGKQVINGWQARQYANVINQHVKKTTNGKTFSDASTAARVSPDDKALQDARRTALTVSSSGGRC